MIVIDSGSSRRQLAARATLLALQAGGLQLSAGADALAKQAARGHLSGSHVSSSGLQLAMQAPGAVIELADDDLTVINERHSSQELTAEDLVVFQDYALSNVRANDRPIQFTTAAIEKLAAHATAGRSVLKGHNRDAVIGATFAGDTVEATVRDVEATWLRLRWYGVTTDQTSPERRQRLQDCRTGTLRFGSVGVVGGDWEFVEIEGPDGWDYFYMIDDSDDLTLREYSRCFMGAATGAGDAKFAAGADSGSSDDTATPPPSSSPAPATKPQVLCVL